MKGDQTESRRPVNILQASIGIDIGKYPYGRQ